MLKIGCLVHGRCSTQLLLWTTVALGHCLSEDLAPMPEDFPHVLLWCRSNAIFFTYMCIQLPSQYLIK